jgi:hypothetical protein
MSDSPIFDALVREFMTEGRTNIRHMVDAKPSSPVIRVYAVHTLAEKNMLQSNLSDDFLDRTGLTGRSTHYDTPAAMEDTQAFDVSELMFPDEQIVFNRNPLVGAVIE